MNIEDLDQFFDIRMQRIAPPQKDRGQALRVITNKEIGCLITRAGIIQAKIYCPNFKKEPGMNLIDKSNYYSLFVDIDYFREPPKIEWAEDGANPDDSARPPRPLYGAEINRLIDAFHAGGFTDPSYLEHTEPLLDISTEELLAYIASAYINDLLSLLTLYIQGEGFREGMLGAAVMSGVIGAILVRLQQLSCGGWKVVPDQQ